LRIWAFGTSRSGLGLDADTLWSLTPREYAALRDIWKEGLDRERAMHAEIIATMFNVGYLTDGVPWTAEDFLGKSTREDRIKQQKFHGLKERIAMMRTGSGVDADAVDDPEWLKDLKINKGLVN
jgi:hypothetical protein